MAAMIDVTKAVQKAILKGKKDTIVSVVKILVDNDVDEAVINLVNNLMNEADASFSKKKRAATSFNLFMKEKMAELKSQLDDGEKMNTRKMMENVSAMWRALDDEEKEKYKEMAKAASSHSDASDSDSESVSKSKGKAKKEDVKDIEKTKKG